MTPSERCNKHRLLSGHTVMSLAAAVGTSHQVISNFERGMIKRPFKRTPHILEAIVREVGMAYVDAGFDACGTKTEACSR